MLPPVVAWADPGKMTGIAVYEFQVLPAYRFTCDELDFRQACSRIEYLCQMHGYSLAIGWERFTINAQTHKKTPQHDALKVIGVAEYMAAKYRCQVLPPAQQESPSAAEQAALRELGWWVPGKDDAQSAAAHMLRWMLRTRQAPPHVVAAAAKGS